MPSDISAASKLGDIGYPLFRESYRWLQGFLKRYYLLVVALSSLAMVGATYVAVKQLRSDREFTLLTGPVGGNGLKQGPGIVDEVEASQRNQMRRSWLPFMQRDYKLKSESTAGYVENYRRVAEDRRGRIVAFALDGLGIDSSGVELTGEVQTLLPLEWEYLHCMVSKDFLKHCALVLNGRPADNRLRRAINRVRIPFGVETDEFKAGQLAFSNLIVAHQMAKSQLSNLHTIERLEEKTIDHEDKDAAEFNKKAVKAYNDSVKAYNDTAEAYKAAVRDVASPSFYLGPPNSATQVLARRVFRHAGIGRRAVSATGILNFDEMRAALRQGNIDGGFQIASMDSNNVQGIAFDKKCRLVSLDYAEGMSRRYPYLLAEKLPRQSYFNGDVTFCPQDAQTLAARRVLIGSANLHPKDGYFIAEAASAALAIPIRWNELSQPGGQRPLIFPEHDGVWKPDTDPPTELTPLSIVGTTIVLSLALGLITDLAAAGVDRLQGKINRRIDQLEMQLKIAKVRLTADAPHRPTQQQLETWTNEYANINERIDDLVQGGRITTNKRERLKVGIKGIEKLLNGLKESTGEPTQHSELADLQNQLDDLNKRVEAMKAPSVIDGGDDVSSQVTKFGVELEEIKEGVQRWFARPLIDKHEKTERLRLRVLMAQAESDLSAIRQQCNSATPVYFSLSQQLDQLSFDVKQELSSDMNDKESSPARLEKLAQRCETLDLELQAQHAVLSARERMTLRGWLYQFVEAPLQQHASSQKLAKTKTNKKKTKS